MTPYHANARVHAGLGTQAAENLPLDAHTCAHLHTPTYTWLHVSCVCVCCLTRATKFMCISADAHFYMHVCVCAIHQQMPTPYLPEGPSLCDPCFVVGFFAYEEWVSSARNKGSSLVYVVAHTPLNILFLASRALDDLLDALPCKRTCVCTLGRIRNRNCDT